MKVYDAVPDFSIENYGDIFGNDRAWFVDDTNTYCVTIHKTSEGNLITNPTNGAAIIFNPKNGLLCLNIIHSSYLSGHKRPSQLAKWTTAEKVAEFMGFRPFEEHPDQIIATRKGIVDPLEVHLIDYPNLIIRGSTLNLPFNALLKIDKIGDIVREATESRTVFLNLYDDWLNLMSPVTAFYRLMLILRGLVVDSDKANMLLKSDGSVVTETCNMWPSFTEEQWMYVEIALRDLILADYGTKNNVNTSALTWLKMTKIVLGGEITTPRAREISDNIARLSLGTEISPPAQQGDEMVQ